MGGLESFIKTDERFIWVNKDGIVRSSNPHKLAKEYPSLILDKDGYHRIWVCRNKKRKFITVHRLVLTAFIKPPSGDFVVNHKNGIRTDNRLENLEWLTPADNERHARNVLKKRCVGEKASRSKLTESQVKEIITSHRSGADLRSLSNIFEISISQVKRIITGKNWEHVWERM